MRTLAIAPLLVAGCGSSPESFAAGLGRPVAAGDQALTIYGADAGEQLDQAALLELGEPDDADMASSAIADLAAPELLEDFALNFPLSLGAGDAHLYRVDGYCQFWGMPYACEAAAGCGAGPMRQFHVPNPPDCVVVTEAANCADLEDSLASVFGCPSAAECPLLWHTTGGYSCPDVPHVGLECGGPLDVNYTLCVGP